MALAAFLGVVGGLLVVVGLALAWLPLGLISAGLALVAVANVLPDLRSGTRVGEGVRK